jgi:uncharacterized protein
MTKLATATALAGEARPVSATDRIQALDVIRGVALCGILLLNIVGFGLPIMAYEDPTVMGGASGSNLTVWWMNTLFFEGTMRTLFSMLFGAGVVLFTSRAEERGAGLRTADIFLRRNLWLIAFGMIHAYVLLWNGEILYTYGIVGLVLFTFRKQSPKMLLIVGIAVLVFLSLQRFTTAQANRSAYESYEQAQTLGLSAAQESAETAAWEAILEEKKPSQETLQESVDGHRQGYLGVVAHNAPTSKYFETTFFYEFFFLDALGAMLLGMALFKMGVLTAQRTTGVYLTMIAIGYAVGLSVNYWEGRVLVDSGFSILAFDRVFITYDVGRLAITAGHVGVVMLLCMSDVLGWLKRALAAVGQMALTNYVMHTVICIFIFDGFGFGLFGQLERHELYYVVVSIWLFQLIASPLWLRKFRFGPLEWAWRSLTYWKKQQMVVSA